MVENMRLGEALTLLADLEKRQKYLKHRTERCLLIQEGDSAPEDPKKLIHRFKAEAMEISRLMAAINHTNLMSDIETSQGKSILFEAVTQRDHLKEAESFFRELADFVAPHRRYQVDEPRLEFKMESSKFINDADMVARDIRELNLAIAKKDSALLLEGYTK